MNEVMMVPVQEFNQLQDYYKGKLTENALLNKAGRLAAEEHLILNDPNIPASVAVKLVKPIAREEGRLVKRLRTGTSGPIAYQGTEEHEGMADAPVENLLKKILKGVNKDPAAPIIIKEEPPSTKKKSVKKKVISTKRPIKPRPSTSKKAKPSKSKKAPPPPPPSSTTTTTTTPSPPSSPVTPSTSRKVPPAATTSKKYSEATQNVLRRLGLDEGGYSPTDVRGKKPKKAKKTKFEKLQEGWEDWDYPYRRGLGYDTDSD